MDFGGRVSFDVVPAVQVFGEFGRIGNVMPSLLETGLAFTRLDVTASAFYGEGGVRLLRRASGCQPVCEGTAGVRPFAARGERLGSTTDAIVRAALTGRQAWSLCWRGVVSSCGPATERRCGLSIQADCLQPHAELGAERWPGLRAQSGLGRA